MKINSWQPQSRATSGSNEQLQQELEYTLLTPDCHSWWISKMQSDILEKYLNDFIVELEWCFKYVVHSIRFQTFCTGI